MFVDFSKAFDSINPWLLLQKFDDYGIRGFAYHLLKFYLRNKIQFVEVNRAFPVPRTIEVGVPQGTVLAPLLVWIYVNDLVDIDSNTKHIIYAEDIFLLFSSDNANKLVSLANTALAELQKWSEANCLTIIAKKNNRYTVSSHKQEMFSAKRY